MAAMSVLVHHRFALPWTFYIFCSWNGESLKEFCLVEWFVSVLTNLPAECSMRFARNTHWQPPPMPVHNKVGIQTA